MSPLQLLSLVAVLVLAAVHAVSARLLALPAVPRSKWLSTSSGMAVAFVFLALIPGMAADQQAVQQASGIGGFLTKHIYVSALFGLATFYGVERFVSTQRQRQDAPPRATRDGAFLLSMAWFSVMNAIIGYLLVQEHRTASDLLFFFAAMALKFVVSDYGLHQAHQANYDRVGKWIVIAALTLGWLVGLLTAVHPVVIGLVRGFLAGGVILNVLKEELPAERKAKYLPFLAGALLYGALLLAV